MFRFLADTEPYPLVTCGGIFLGCKFTTAMRAIAKRLRLTHAAGTPPIVLSLFDSNGEGRIGGAQGLGHGWFFNVAMEQSAVDLEEMRLCRFPRALRRVAGLGRPWGAQKASA